MHIYFSATSQLTSVSQINYESFFSAATKSTLQREKSALYYSDKINFAATKLTLHQQNQRCSDKINFEEKKPTLHYSDKINFAAIKTNLAATKINFALQHEATNLHFALKMFAASTLHLCQQPTDND